MRCMRQLPISSTLSCSGVLHEAPSVLLTSLALSCPGVLNEATIALLISLTLSCPGVLNEALSVPRIKMKAKVKFRKTFKVNYNWDSGTFPKAKTIF